MADLTFDVNRETFPAAILFADLVGYTLLMSRDEIGTLEFMVSSTRMIEETAEGYGGKLVQITGDGFLILFGQARSAIDFGVQLHRKIKRHQPASGDIAAFRVGIHFGIVHLSAGIVHGHAVNVAARLESEALPGSCVVSQLVRDAVADDRYEFRSIGAPPLKNVSERIELFRTGPEDALERSKNEVALLMLAEPICLRHMGAVFECSDDFECSALLAYLALSEGRKVSRSKIGSLLWPDLPPTQAVASLMMVCGRLSVELDAGFPGLLEENSSEIWLNDLHYETDLEEWLFDLRRGRVPNGLIADRRWPHKILANLDGHSASFDAWLSVVRRGWIQRILDALTPILREKSLSATTVQAANAILAAEPGHELASSTLIRHLSREGNRVAALEEYERICHHLREKHNLEPSVLLRDARLTVVGGGGRADTEATPVAHSPVRRLLRLVIEPFVDETNVASAFRDDLKANLSRFRDWAVVEGGGPPDGTAVASGLDYMVGGVQKNREELSLFLKDIQNDRLLWAEDVNLYEENPNSAQQTAIGRIAAHLETYISADRLSATIGADAPLRLSHDAWLEAERIFARWTPEAAEEATGILRGVIDADPTFAPAHSSLASFENVRHIIRPGAPRDAEAGREADGFARRAVELDPLDARNQLAVAWTAALIGSFDRAALHLDMAEDLNPNDPTTLISSAMARAFLGEAERAEGIIAHVKRIAPMLSEFQWCYVAAVHFFSGRYEDALYAARMSGDRIADNQGWIAATLAQLGRIDEAKAAFSLLMDSVSGNWAGEGPPTSKAVFEWFCGAYPLRREADRARLAGGLALVLGE